MFPRMMDGRFWSSENLMRGSACEASVEPEKERVGGSGEVEEGRMNAGLMGVTGG